MFVLILRYLIAVTWSVSFKNYTHGEIETLALNKQTNIFCFFFFSLSLLFRNSFESREEEAEEDPRKPGVQNAEKGFKWRRSSPRYIQN